MFLLGKSSGTFRTDRAIFGVTDRWTYRDEREMHSLHYTKSRPLPTSMCGSRETCCAFFIPLSCSQSRSGVCPGGFWSAVALALAAWLSSRDRYQGMQPLARLGFPKGGPAMTSLLFHFDKAFLPMVGDPIKASQQGMPLSDPTQCHS